MMGRYQRVWDTVSSAVDEEERQLMQEESKQLRQFFDERWKETNIQVCEVGRYHAWRCTDTYVHGLLRSTDTYCDVRMLSGRSDG